jgi:hypothetical protein
MIIKLVVLFIIVYFIDFFVGTLLRNLYFTQESGKLYRTTYSLETTTADLLIFGSSTASHDYSPKVFENRLHMSTYNAGRDGTSIFFQYAILKGVLKRYSPEMILLNFDLEEFKKDADSYDRISSLLPYYKTHPELRDIINMKSSKEKIKLFSKIYPFNSMLFTILAGNSEFNKTRREDIQGFLPLNKVFNKPLKSGYYPDAELDSNKIEMYKSFIHDCAVSNIKLYIVCSPYYHQLKNIPNSVILGKKIASENHVRFFNFLNDTTFNNHSSYYADPSHLNYEGAKIFTDKLIDRITNESGQQPGK